jgi:hypothetical protein
VTVLYGPTFGSETVAAGLGGAPFSWNEDTIYGRENLTPAQNTTLDNVIAAHDPSAQLKNVILTTDFIARFTNAEYLALEKKRRDDITANNIGIAKNWDIVVTDPQVNLNRQKVQNIKTDLVNAGVLTQARADEIFS